MWKIISIVFTGVIVSLYFFPFELSLLPGINTKMMLAVIGVFLSVYNLISRKSFTVPSEIFQLTIAASMVSVIGLISVIINNTVDYVYATYVISMLVWLSAAFTVCCLIKKVHGYLNVPLVVNYLTVVCVSQCIMALVIATSPSLKGIIDSYILQGQTFLNEVDRIYGIGASLDVAGTRFSACLIMLTVMIHKNVTKEDYVLGFLYLVAYMIIFVLGNMIARTTSVGIVLSAIYIMTISKPLQMKLGKNGVKLTVIATIMAALTILLFTYLYRVDEQIHDLLRFAFEGFFNLAETGEYYFASTSKLATMYVFPESVKTWIIGDGFFNNPINVDPYFIGKVTGGYYMGTDVGYLRFIFYFGLLGLGAFMSFMGYASKICSSKLPEYKQLFVLILISGFIIWFKVSTDLFIVFALFICVSQMQDQVLEEKEVSYENSI